MLDIKETINKMLGKLNTLDDNQWRLIPIGQINLFSGGTIPDGWLPCDGRAISRTVYPELFAVIGTAYGTGDGSTTFNLPDFRNRMPIGAGSLYSLNSTGGNKDMIVPYHNHSVNAINTGNMSGNVTHNHNDGTHGSSGISASGGSTSAIVYYNASSGTRPTTSTSVEHTHSVPAHNTNYAGTSGNLTNANLPPYKGINFIIFTGVLQSNMPAAIWQDLNSRISNSVLNIPIVTNFTDTVNFSNTINASGVANFNNQVYFNNIVHFNSTVTVSDPTQFRTAINAVSKSGDTMSGDLCLKTGTDDSPDIVWQYANGTEKMRIWSPDNPTGIQGPNFRIYNSSGTALYSGTLVPTTGQGATGAWGISLASRATIGGGSYAAALQSYFNSYKASVPRNAFNNFYSSAYGNGALVFGYYLSGYDSNPYGGYYVCHYNTARYVGIQNGTYTEYVITKSAASSLKIKENIKPITTLEASKLYNLNVVSFDYKKEYENGKKNQLGLIAEEVNKIIPNAVYKPEGEDTIWSIEYEKFIPYLIKCCQMQKEHIDILEQEIQELKSK